MDYDFEKLKDGILETLGLANKKGITVDELLKSSQDLCRKLEAAELSKTTAPSTNSEPNSQSQVDPIIAGSSQGGSRPENDSSNEALGGAVGLEHQPLDAESNHGVLPGSDPVDCESEEWKSNLWSYLTTLPDFYVGPENEGSELSLAEIQALPLLPSDQDIQDEGEDEDSGVISTRAFAKTKRTRMRAKGKTETTISGDKKAANSFTFQPRIFTSQSKVWYTLTGRDVDWVWLPQSEFDILCVISLAGKAGVDQPTLIKLTGQDKKSLPRRTYALENKNLVEKRPVVIHRHNTHWLTLKQFVDEEIKNGTHYSQIIKQPISTTDMSLVPGSEYWTGTVIYEDAMLQRTIDLIESWQAIVYDDAKKKMGVDGSKWHMKIFSKRTRMLCDKAIIEKGLFLLPGPFSNSRKSLRLLHKPTDAEWAEIFRQTNRDVPDPVGTKTKTKAKAKKPKNIPKRSSRKKEEVEEDDLFDSEPDMEDDNVAAADDEAGDDGDLEADAGEDDAISQRNGGLQEADEQGLSGELSNSPDPEHLNPLTSTGEILGGIETPDEASNDATIPAAELSNSSQPSNTADQVHHIVVESTDARQHDLNEASLSSTQPLPTTLPTIPPRPPKRRGRPPGRKDSTPRRPKNAAQNTDQDVSQLDAPNSRGGSEAAVPVPQRPIRTALFTSYEDLQRQAGVAGVYINPTGSGYSRRKRNVMVAVFKTDLLKTWDPNARSANNAVVEEPSQAPSTVLSAINNSISQPFPEHALGSHIQGQALPPSRNGLPYAAQLLSGASSRSYQSPYTYKSPYSALPQTASNAGNHASASASTPSAYPNSWPSRQDTHGPSTSRNEPMDLDIDTNGPTTSHTEPMDLDTVADHVSSPSSVNKNLSTGSKPSENDAMFDPLEDSLKPASYLVLPGETGFILTMWNDSPGKLRLADDKKCLLFFSAQTEIPTSPDLEIQTSSISAFPTVSKTQPNSGGLQVECNEHTHIFIIPTSEEALEAANNLRAKIVTAMLGQGFQEKKKIKRTPTSGDSGKDYQCEICLKRWKNDNGLMYHQTKSRTACNPNYRPEEVISNSRHSSINPNIIASTQTPAAETRQSSLPASSAYIAWDDPRIDIGDELDDASDRGLKRKAREISIDDCDFVPDEATGLSSRKRRRKAPNTTDQGPASSTTPAKTPQPNESTPDVDLVADSDDEMDEMDLDTDTSRRPGRKTKKKYKAKNAPAPDSTQSIKNIIFDLVETNGGIFSGDIRCLWMVCAGELRKRYPGLAHPESSKCNAALKSLINGKRIKKNTSSFTAKNGLTKTLQVIHKGSIEPDKEAIEKLKDKMKDCYPNTFVPSEFMPPNSIVEELRMMEEEAEQRKHEVEFLSNPYYMQKAAEAAALKENERAEAEQIKAAAEEIKAAAELIKKSAQPKTRRRRRKPVEEQHVPDSDSPRETPEQEQHVVFAETARLGSNDSELHGAEEEEPIVETSFLQNPVTGCWDVPTSGSHIAERKKKKYARKPRLPEVITFMQSEGNSTWSFQPYGHGARPIYARPGRRVVGNPATNARLRRLQGGNRPISVPQTQMIAPARGSKLLTHPPPKRQRLSNGHALGRGRGSMNFSLPHKRPANMMPTPIVIPPTSNYPGPVVFLPPNTELDDGPVDEEDTFKYPGATGIFLSHKSNALDWDNGEHLSWYNPPWESEKDYEPELKRAISTPNPAVQLGRPRKPYTYAPLKHFKTRKLTHFKDDFKSTDDLTNVPIVTDYKEPPTAPKGLKAVMSPETENRFIVTQIAIYTIAGGVGRAQDHVLVARLFPQYTMHKIVRFWKNIRKRRGKEIPIIENRFQEAFLKGYEDGVLPVLNYDDLLNYDWGFVVDWYMKKFPVVSGSLLDGLPSTRSSLLEDCEITDMQPTENWRDIFVGTHTATSKHKRHQISTRDQLTVPLHPARASTTFPDKDALARSVVRAAVSTPKEVFKQDVADMKLKQIGEEAAQKAKTELISNKSINHKNKGRSLPNQNYHFTETYKKTLMRQAIKLATFSQAREYKQKLDTQFRNGQSMKLERKQTDGASMCITNLLAHDRIRIIQSQVPSSKYGLLTNSYETNTINKEQLLFTMEIVPTNSYLYNDQLNLKFDIPQAPGNAIPAWIDMNGDVIPDFWRQIQEGVFAALAVRAGATARELAKTFYPTLMEWELQLLLEWGEKVGALRRIEEGFEGWSTGEWWWMIPGM